MIETAVKEQKVIIDAEKQKALDMAISKIEKDFIFYFGLIAYPGLY